VQVSTDQAAAVVWYWEFPLKLLKEKHWRYRTTFTYGTIQANPLPLAPNNQ